MENNSTLSNEQNKKKIIKFTEPNEYKNKKNNYFQWNEMELEPNMETKTKIIINPKFMY